QRLQTGPARARARHDVRTGIDQRVGDRKPDALARSRDDGGLSRQVQVHLVPSAVPGLDDATPPTPRPSVRLEVVATAPAYFDRLRTRQRPSSRTARPAS